MEVRLKDFVQVRCGDKGNDSDITVFAPSEQIYDFLKDKLSEEHIKHFFGDMVNGKVTRYEVPNVLALKFHLQGALGGGAASSLRIDNLGKTLGSALLRMKIDLPSSIEIQGR
ncbi:hypothetical protein V7147_16045 [Bacillus sp. JJ1521]|uniref:AtuA-related protein n=1 Tax=Bacillus sp. JJ1521 TaxID=3122957 RepID=UPI0030000F9F